MQLRSWKVFVVLLTVLLMGALVGTNGYGMEIPKADWKVIYVSSEEKVAEDGRGVLAIDGKPETFWHSQWKAAAPKHPHEIHIDMGKSYELVGFKYLPRQGSTHGRIKKYEFYISNSSTAWGTAIKIGEFDSTDIEKVVAFPAVAGRYIRMVALSEINARAYASLAELSVLGVDDFVFPQGQFKVVFTPSPDARATGHCLYLKNLSTSAEERIDLLKATEKVLDTDRFLPDTVYEITAAAYGKVDGKDAESVRSNSVKIKIAYPAALVQPGLLKVLEL